MTEQKACRACRWWEVSEEDAAAGFCHISKPVGRTGTEDEWLVGEAGPWLWPVTRAFDFCPSWQAEDQVIDKEGQ